MRKFVYGLLAILFVSVFIIWLWKFGIQFCEEPVSNWLAVAGILVTVATFTSMAFAIMNYMEAIILRQRVDEAKNELENKQHQFARKMDEIQNLYYGLALAAFKGLTETFMSLKDPEDFRVGMNCLRFAEIEIHLARATEDSLKEAIQNAFKISRRCFLEMESAIWDKTESMKSEGKKAVRTYYSNLKSIILDRLKD